MNRLSTFRSEHPDFEMQMVSYEDVLVTVGTRSYIDFCRKNRIKTCRISGDGVIERARMDMNRAGIDTLTFIDYNMREEDVSFARETGRAVMLRNVRAGMEARSDMKSWTDRIGYLRERGITAPIYATAGITCGQDILEVKAAGAAGAFVGSCLMTRRICFCFWRSWNGQPITGKRGDTNGIGKSNLLFIIGVSYVREKYRNGGLLCAGWL